MGLLLQPEIPLSPSQQGNLRRFAEGLTRDQLLWASGYLSALAIATEAKGKAPSTEGQVTILFGTETGNAARLAQTLAAKARGQGVPADARDMLGYGRAQLRQDRTLLVIVSTHGDGEPPENARALHALLTGDRAPDLHGHRFAVLALGDASYPRFCQAGKDFDAAFAAAGAERLIPRVDCDVDYEEIATRWMEEVLAIVTTGANPHLAGRSTPALGLGRSPQAPYPAPLAEKVKLSGRGSSREIWHLELDVEGSDLHYAPGDIVSVSPVNPPPLVEELLDRLKLDGGTLVRTRHAEMPLAEALASRYEITRLTRPFLERWVRLSDAEGLRGSLAGGDGTALGAWMDGREIIDVVGLYPVHGLDAQSFVDTLRPLPPRRYSIASSILACPGEVHLTVAAVRYRSHGRDRVGVASTFLADRVAIGQPVPMVIEPNPQFRLPEDPAQAVIMIGAGTGVAPFRAFLQERETLGATGRNWLFFGDRHFCTDFLYQREWLHWLDDGRLTRLDVAFSRDQECKVYVQDRLRERADAVNAWLEEGAALYVCGAEAMGRAVHRTLAEIVQAGGRTPEQVEEYISELKTAGRYHRDVY